MLALAADDALLFAQTDPTSAHLGSSLLYCLRPMYVSFAMLLSIKSPTSCSRDPDREAYLCSPY